MLARTAWEAEASHLGAVELALVTIKTGLLVGTLVQELAALLCTLTPQLAAAVIAPLSPHFIEGRNVIAGVCMAITEPVRRKGDELRLGVYEIHLLLGRLLAVSGRLLTTEAAKTAESTGASLGCVLLGLDAVQDILRLSLIVDAGIVAPAVGGEDKGCDEVELAVAGCACRVLRTISAAAPGEVALANAILMLHILL